MRFTVLSCMNGFERLWVGGSDGDIFQIGYHTLMKLSEEKILDRAISVPCRVEAKSGVIRHFYPSRRGVTIQLVQHLFDGGFTVCGYAQRAGRRVCWYIWIT